MNAWRVNECSFHFVMVPINLGFMGRENNNVGLEDIR